jgi:pimeloyl-ACP methyl ester carboxylesterase
MVAGEFDRNAAPSVMKQMAASVPRARYAEIAGMGHLMNLEAPDVFDAVLLEFLRAPSPAPLPGAH